MVILYLRFVPSQLTFHFRDHIVEGRLDTRMSLAGNEIVLVLGGDEQLHLRFRTLEFDRHANRRQPLEQMREFGKFFLDIILRFGTDGTMSRGNRNFHHFCGAPIHWIIDAGLASKSESIKTVLDTHREVNRLRKRAEVALQ